MRKAISTFFSSPQNQMMVFATSVSAYFLGNAWQGAMSWLGAGWVVICVGLYYWLCVMLCKRVEQKDYKAVVTDGDKLFKLDSKYLENTTIANLETPIPLEELLNESGKVSGRLMYKQDKLNLPPTSAILQIVFLPIDKNGKTMVWNRKWKFHTFNRSWTVLVSHSPVCDSFGKTFVKNLEDKSDAGRRVCLADMYIKAVKAGKDAPTPEFNFVTACWRTAETNERAAYCFYLYAARYPDVSFDDPDMAAKIFGSKRIVGVRHRTISLTGENRDNITKSVSLPCLDNIANDLAMEGVDRFVAERFRDFLNSGNSK